VPNAEFILRAADAAQLAASVEDNLFALFKTAAARLGGDLIQDQYGARYYTFADSPFFNGVWALHLNESNADATIDEIVAWYKARGVSAFFWWHIRSSAPPDIGQRLMARGFTPHGDNAQTYLASGDLDDLGSPCMVADLHHMDEAALARVPPDFTISIARSEQDLDDFKQAFMRSYAAPERRVQAWVDATLHIGFRSPIWTIYIGRLRGEPVAINVLYKGGGVAGLYAVGTVPEARGMGIGAAITLQPLLDARRDGYQYGVLFASKMGLGVYERLGFSQTGTNFPRFVWQAG
jgi:GNAT superfamily N-acetyltransferase